MVRADVRGGVGRGADGVAQAPLHVVMGHGGAPLTYNTALQPDAIWRLIKLSHGYLRISANATSLDVEVRCGLTALGPLASCGRGPVSIPVLLKCRGAWISGDKLPLEVVGRVSR